MVKQKVLNIQFGHIYDIEKQKNIPVILSAYPKKSKKGETYYQGVINVFVAEMEVKEKEDNSQKDL